MNAVRDATARLRARVAGQSENRRRILDSSLWTLAERLVTLIASWGASIVVANYLGVDDFGQLLFAVALVTLFATVVGAGLSGLVVRDLVRLPAERFAILGTVFLIRLVAGVLALVLLLGVTLFALGDIEGQQQILIVIVAIGMLFKVSEVLEFWFQSETQLRYVSIANLLGTMTGAVLRVGLVVAGAPLVAFAWAVAIEQILMSLALVVTYRRTVGPFRLWRFERSRGKQYLGQSWPLIVAGVANTVNLRIDQVMLGIMVGSSAVGTYAVAARLSEVWFFVPTALAAAVFPAVIRARAYSDELYRKRLRQLYAGFIWGAIGVAVVVSLLSRPLIDLLYSAEYAGAADVLIVHVWTAPFLFASVIFSKWLIIEGLLYASMIRHSAAALINVGLNLILIPRYGPIGSAFATLISYAVATYGACFLTKSTRQAGIDMTLGFIYPIRVGATWASTRLRA